MPHGSSEDAHTGSTTHDNFVEIVQVITSLFFGFVGLDLPARAAWNMAIQTGDIRQLATLVEVSQTLASTLNLEAALHRVLEILEQHHSMIPSMVTLLNKDSSELGIAVANGLPADGMQARYNVGEGITGRVVER